VAATRSTSLLYLRANTLVNVYSYHIYIREPEIPSRWRHTSKSESAEARDSSREIVSDLGGGEARNDAPQFPVAAATGHQSCNSLLYLQQPVVEATTCCSCNSRLGERKFRLGAPPGPARAA
jgi:hypothetical protein